VAAAETYFGQQVRSLRLACGISQEELGFLADIHATYVGKLERGEKSPTLGVIRKIAKALGMSGSELMRLAEESMPSDIR
jgi:transcriptional regulator with XRE-family HTH domain